MIDARSKVRLGEHTPDVDLNPDTTKSDIVKLLYRNDEYGYQPQAVHKTLDIPHNTAKVTLRRLKSEEYIGQTDDGYYHALGAREDVYRYVGSLDGLDRMFDTEDSPEASASEAENSHTNTEPTLSEEEIESVIAVLDEN